MYEILINGELYHHGVKGQKWGVRKKRDSGLYNKLTSGEKKKLKEYRTKAYKFANEANQHLNDKKINSRKKYESSVKNAQKYVKKMKNLAYRNLSEYAIETGNLYISNKEIITYT